MNHPSATAPDPFARREYPFSAADFAAIAAYAHRHFGISLPESKRQLVYSRLSRRLRALGLEDFSAYAARLEGPEAKAEHAELLKALATHTTHFFREAHHFELLESTVLPPLIDRARNGGRVRIWSAGCSAGQEPYSVAMTILRHLPDARQYDLRILATDVVPTILARARAATYPEEERKAIPADLRERFTLPAGAEAFSLTADVTGLVTFGVLNLIEPLPVRGPFDVILCRNVAIYFDKQVQQHVWSAFASVLAPDGHLFIGHSERLSGAIEAEFRSCGVTAYRHVPAARAIDRSLRRSLA